MTGVRSSRFLFRSCWAKVRGIILSECVQMFDFVPPRLQRFAKDILWIAVALLAVTGAFEIAKDPAIAPSWQILLGLIIGTALRCAFTHEKRSTRLLS